MCAKAVKMKLVSTPQELSCKRNFHPKRIGNQRMAACGTIWDFHSLCKKSLLHRGEAAGGITWITWQALALGTSQVKLFLPSAPRISTAGTCERILLSSSFVFSFHKLVSFFLYFILTWCKENTAAYFMCVAGVIFTRANSCRLWKWWLLLPPLRAQHWVLNMIFINPFFIWELSYMFIIISITLFYNNNRKRKCEKECIKYLN